MSPLERQIDNIVFILHFDMKLLIFFVSIDIKSNKSREILSLSSIVEYKFMKSSSSIANNKAKRVESLLVKM